MQTGFHFDGEEELIQVVMGEAPILLLMMAAALALEVFLALKKDGRLGLLPPGLWLLKCVAQLAVWMSQVSGYSSVAEMGGMLALAFCVENIPTLLLLAAYGLCRLYRRRKTARQLKKIGRAHV